MITSREKYPMSRIQTLTSSAALLIALMLPSLGYADVILPEEEVCDGKSAGDSCELDDGSMGTCEDGERCRPLPDMGQDCIDTLICEAGGENNTGNNSAGNNATGNNSAGNNSAGNNSAGNNSTGNNNAGNNSAGNNSSGGEEDMGGDTSSDDDSSGGDDESGCASAGSAALPSLSLLLGLMLLGWARRREDDA